MAAMSKNLCVAALVLLAFGGCDSETETPAASTTSTTSTPGPANEPAQAAPAYKPTYTVEIQTMESDPPQYRVVWTAEVNTGGWKMTTESVLVEDSMGVTSARIFAILEQPGPSETVTEAMETVTGTHDAGTQQVDQAELSIKRIVRGVEYDFPPLYVIVKQGNRTPTAE